MIALLTVIEIHVSANKIAELLNCRVKFDIDSLEGKLSHFEGERTFFSFLTDRLLV